MSAVYYASQRQSLTCAAGRNPLADKAGNVERESKEENRKKKAIPQSALIDCGMKGVEIGSMDLSSSTQGLPSSLHEIRQLYVLKGSTGRIIARLDAAIEQSILLTL